MAILGTYPVFSSKEREGNKNLRDGNVILSDVEWCARRQVI